MKPENQDHPVHLGSQVRGDFQVFQGKMGKLAKMVDQVLLDHRDLLDLEVFLECLVYQESRDIGDFLG